MTPQPADHLLKPVQRRLMIPLVFALSLLIIGFVITQAVLHNKQLSLSSEQQIDNILHSLDLSIDFQSRLLLTLQDLILSDEATVELLQNYQREKLLDRYQARFQTLLTTHGITHFYFHTAEGINLLRLHRPDLHGDKINRYTLRQAKQTGLPSSGFEIGPQGTFTLRVVKPVFRDNVVVGFLELGREINGLLSELHNLENVEVAFLIHKKSIPGNIQTTMVRPQYHWNRYRDAVLLYASDPQLAEVLDQHLTAAHIHDEGHQHKFVVAPGGISNRQNLLNTGAIHETRYKNDPALLSIFPFSDASGEFNSDLILLNNIAKSSNIFFQSTIVWVSIATIIFLMLVSFLHAFLKTVDRGIHQQQEELINSNDRLNKAISVAKDGIWDWNLKTQMVTFDDRYFTMAGYQPNDFNSNYQEWRKRIHPEDAPIVDKAVTDYLHNKTERYDIEFRFQRKDGSYMWIRARGKIFEYDDSGEPLRFVGTHADITERMLVQQSLASSEEKFRKLIETMHDWVWEVDAQGIYTYSSPRCVDLLGYQPEEIVGKSPFDLMPEDEATRVAETFQQIVTSQQPIDSLVNTNLRKDGKPVVLETSGIPFFDADGKLAGYRGIDRNITERKLLDQQLRDSEQKYRLLVENQNDMVVEVDPNGVFLFVSPSYCELFEKTELELLGNTFMPLVHEDDQILTRQEMEKLFKPPYYCYLQQRAMTRHGWRWLEWMDTAVLDDHGQVKSIIGVGRDISERKQAEQALRESESRYRVVFNQQFQFMAILSTDGIALEVNDLPLTMAGIKREDVVGKPFWITPFWEGLDEWEDNWKQRMHEARTSRQPYQGQDIYLTADGTLRHAESTTTAIFDEQDELLFYLIQASDTTARHNAESQRDELLDQVQSLNVNLELRVRQRTAELKSVNKELESFSYSVSHDLRAPLRAIDGFSLALQEDYGALLDDTGHDYINRVRNSAQRMGQLIDDLLQLSRVNRDEINVQRTDLTSIAEEVFQELKTIDLDRKVSVEIGRNLDTEGDPRLLRIMLDNLLGNAWKFTTKTENASIVFDRSTQDDQVFFIQDNGVGFDMSHAKNLFGAFQRMHRVSDFPGTGIGLATVQRILNRHGGSIWAEAEEGKGAIFYFSMVANYNKNQQGDK